MVSAIESWKKIKYTPSADEGDVMWSKAPNEATNRLSTSAADSSCVQHRRTTPTLAGKKCTFSSAVATLLLRKHGPAEKQRQDKSKLDCAAIVIRTQMAIINQIYNWGKI